MLLLRICFGAVCYAFMPYARSLHCGGKFRNIAGNSYRLSSVLRGDEEKGGMVNFGHRAGCMVGLEFESGSLFVLTALCCSNGGGSKIIFS